jgi:heterodisulfide reductase subunit C
MAIDIPALMDRLRQLAVQNHVTVAEPDVLRFHRTVLDSVERYGRTHKLEIMMRFKLTTRRWLQDWQAGLKMLAKRKLDLLPSRIKHIEAIAPFFKTASREKSDD